MISGIDISHWEGHVDWDTFFASDHKQRFIIFKATESYNFVDQEVKANWAALAGRPIIRGAYHYFHASVDPIKQADWFLKTVGDFSSGTLPPILDLEKKDASANKTQSRAGTWIKTVEKATGLKPILYTSPGFWAEKLAAWGAFDWTVNHYPLWLAHYGVAAPVLPKGWKRWDFWQYATDGRFEGIPGACDLNWFDGAVKELYALANSAPPPDMRPFVPQAEWVIKFDEWAAERLGYDGPRPAV